MVCAYGKYSVLVSQVHCVISMYNCKLHPSSGVCCINYHSSVRTLTSKMLPFFTGEQPYKDMINTVILSRVTAG